MIPFIIAILIGYVCTCLGPKYKSQAYKEANPRRRSKRWINKAMKHGVKFYVHKDPNYIKWYKSKYGRK